MKTVIAGGSGQVGRILVRALKAQGHEVVILSRTPENGLVGAVGWDGRTLGPWQRQVEGADVVINLAGRNVNCRYGKKNRRLILESRVDSSRVIGKAIAGAKRPPRVWLQASTATIYAHRFDAANDEEAGLIGGEEDNAPSAWAFSIDVARAWEEACVSAPTPRTRKVLMRSAMTMSPDRSGIFDTLRKLAQVGLGGTASTGKQYVSWIHEADFIRSVNWLIENDGLSGPINIASPNPMPNAQFMRALRRACKAPVGLPATRWMLEVGAWAMRTETELILKSRRVVPTRLLESGFKFEYPDWESAVKELCRRQQSGKPALQSA